MPELEAYKDKRDFSKTPEPVANSPSTGEGNRFVVQKHWARREHYDFRIEVGNVLVSWAIPKKPVEDPEIKRLAVKTEDHPLNYIHFEGTIPKGNYGAGTVMVWDYGYYYSDKNRSVMSAEEVKNMLQEGTVKIHLQGRKLNGVYILVKINKSKKDEWLFMKAKDQKPDDDADRSALTGKTMEEIATGTVGQNPDTNKDDTNKDDKNKNEKNQDSARKLDFPGFISPMLASPIEKAFSDQNWIYELKIDGYRIVSTKNNRNINLFSRNGNDFNQKYSNIREELQQLKANFIIDGEVSYWVDGKADFQKLQDNYSRQENLHYFAFDILWLNGHDLSSLPLIKRKELLKTLLTDAGTHIHYLEHIEKEGEKFFHEIEDQELEGIIAKRKDSHYHPGWRSGEWLKIKTTQRQEMVICGYVKSGKSDREFRSLLCAVSSHGKFVYTGKVGTGFSQAKQKQIMKLLSAYITEEAVVENPPTDKDITWLKPEVVCEVKFTEWTADGVMRHPVFIALREDKTPEQIKIIKPRKGHSPKKKISLSNPDKLFWPEEKILKKDVFSYYESIADVILPYLKDRPQSLYRTPDGIQNKGFFQKNMRDAPEWVKTISVESGSGKDIEYLLCQDIDTLLYMVNLGCIEINPWNALFPRLAYPDLMVFDLDPLDIEFAVVIDVAVEFRELFEKLEMPSFIKTSGGRGLHIYVPVKPYYTHKQVQNFARTLEMHVHKKMKKYTSLERSPSRRKGKIYLDYLQNGRGKTMASVYSLRPRPGAPVSMPLHWDDLDRNLDPVDFNIHSAPGMLAQQEDPWEGMLHSGVDLQEIIREME